MARPRSISDDALLDAAAEELANEGPESFTLARAGIRAGVSAATYIKRFRSKQGVLLALSHRWAASMPTAIDEAVAGLQGRERLLAALMVGLEDLEVYSDPRRTSNLLAVFARDLADPELRLMLEEGWRAQRQAVTRLLTEADVSAHLPAAPDAASAARILMALVEGLRIAWCLDPDGPLSEQVRRDVDLVLRGWVHRGAEESLRTGG